MKNLRLCRRIFIANVKPPSGGGDCFTFSTAFYTRSIAFYTVDCFSHLSTALHIQSIALHARLFIINKITQNALAINGKGAGGGLHPQSSLVITNDRLAD
ncbi:hypothetical protein A8M56_18765 [Yersinia pestis]|nr:hypothetical protein A8M56_18765 [Yersinia pestis]